LTPKSGKPVDYDPRLDVQQYAGIGGFAAAKPRYGNFCPWWSGAPTFFPRRRSIPKRLVAYVAAGEGLHERNHH